MSHCLLPESRALAVTVLLAGCLAAGNAQTPLPPNVEPAKTPLKGNDAKKAPRHIKVFKLTHAQPEDVSPVLEELGYLGEFGNESGSLSKFNERGRPLRPATLRVGVDDRTRSLVVRGTDTDLQIAADLVAVIDLPADKLVPKVKTLRAFRLKHAKANDLVVTLRDLELEAKIVAHEKGNTLVASGPEDALKDIEEVVVALDVEAKEPPPEPEKKPDQGK